MSLPELLIKYLNTPYVLVALAVAMLFFAYQYFKKNKFPVQDLLQGNNLEREFGLSLIGIEDEIDIHREGNDERSTFTPSVFSTDSSPAILVVEPNEEMRLFITNALRLNYRVIALSDGMKAYQKALEMVPDLIVINTYIGGMEGMTLCHTLKSTEATNHIPVIMLTGRGEVQQNSSEIQFNADAYLVKPFDARELLISVRNLIDLRKKLQIAFRDQLTTGLPLADFGPADVIFLKRLFDVLHHHYSDPAFTAEELAAEFSFTKMQLYRKIKALTNRTPGEILKLYRVEQAKQMLVTEDQHVNAIATRAGFSNLASFNKVFKEHTGIFPIEFTAQSKVAADPVDD